MNRFDDLFEGKYPRWISLPLALGSHWIFQGILYMDRTERRFKIGFDVFVFLLLIPVTTRFTGVVSAVATSVLLAHTINFIVNGQVFVVLKHYGYVETDLDEFDRVMHRIADRAGRSDYISSVVALGSLSRNELQSKSDLDIRVIRRKGAKNGLKTGIFVLRERFNAFLQRFPLDIYFIDGSGHLDRIDEAERENLIVLYDSNGDIDHLDD